MADVHDRKTRSYNMSMIRSKDTKPEIMVRKFLFGNGFRYKLHDKTLPGKQDCNNTILSKLVNDIIPVFKTGSGIKSK